MAPAASVVQATTKVKRPMAIQTNGINSSTSSPSPSMSAGRLPSGPKYPPNSATSNGGGNSTGVRSANRARPGQLLGRGQRNNSAGLRSGSVVGELAISQVAQTQPYGN
jgi:transcription factor SPT20